MRLPLARDPRTPYYHSHFTREARSEAQGAKGIRPMAYKRLLSLDELQAAADHNSPVFGPADVDCASCCDFLLDEPGSCLSQVTAETTKLDVSSALPTPRLLFDAPRLHQQIELPPSTLFDSPCHGGRAASPSAEEPSASAEVPPPP